MASKTTKAGWKTTEFWLTTVATLTGIVIAAGVVDPEGSSGIAKEVGLIVSALAAMCYTVSRGLAKSK